MAVELVDVSPIQYDIEGCTVRLVKDDLTALAVDAIVHYARPDLKLGSGFGNALAVRGGPKIQEELNGHPPLAVGKAVATGGGNLKARFVVHAVGPRFQEEEIESKLKTTMHSALNCAEQKGAKSVAFPAMGAGFYGIPLRQCARTMLQAIHEYLKGKTGLTEVIICVTDRREFASFRDEIRPYAALGAVPAAHAGSSAHTGGTR